MLYGGSRGLIGPGCILSNPFLRALDKALLTAQQAVIDLCVINDGIIKNRAIIGDRF